MSWIASLKKVLFRLFLFLNKYSVTSKQVFKQRLYILELIFFINLQNGNKLNQITFYIELSFKVFTSLKYILIFYSLPIATVAYLHSL